MEEEKNNGSWTSWKVYVIKAIEKLEKKQNDLEEAQHKHELENKGKLTEIGTKVNISSAIISTIMSIIVTLTAATIIYVTFNKDDNSKIIEQKVKKIIEQKNNKR